MKKSMLFSFSGFSFSLRMIPVVLLAASIGHAQAPTPAVGTVTPTVTPTSSSIWTIGQDPRLQVADSGFGPLAALIGACTAFFSGPFSNGASAQANVETSNTLLDSADRLNDGYGNRYEPEFSEDDQKGLGADANVYLNADCGNFVDREGRLGPWGRTALEEIKRQPDSYENKNPPDILRMCPGYAKMGRERRRLFWVWVMSALASSESSCNPKALNPKCTPADVRARRCSKVNPNSPPNGDAIGLFQYGSWQCGGAGKTQLENPHYATRCAARDIGVELSKRETLLDYERETNWGPFRGNTRHAGDQKGRNKTLDLIPKFRYCGAGGGV